MRPFRTLRMLICLQDPDIPQPLLLLRQSTRNSRPGHTCNSRLRYRQTCNSFSNHSRHSRNIHPPLFTFITGCLQRRSRRSRPVGTHRPRLQVNSMPLLLCEPLSRPTKCSASHASDLDYTSSPKKRKAQGGHPAPPPPTSAPQSHTSPSYSRASSSTSTPRRGHARARSDASTRGQDGPGGPLSRLGTYSIQEHAESGVQQSRYSDQRYPEPPREPTSQYQQPQYAQQQQQQQHPPTLGSAFRRDDGREGPPPMAIQTETRQSGAQHHVAGHGHRSVPASPRREVGGQ